MNQSAPPANTSNQLTLPANAFTKFDPAPDAQFYFQPRLVNHIDAGAIAAVTAIYREILPPGGDILDLMSSWVSHLPPEIDYRSVTGLGLNPQELAANPRLSQHFVQDLNLQPLLPWENNAFDATAICVSVQYLQRPIEVFSEIARVLRPAAPLVVTFSNRCFPTKAVAIWRALQGPQQQRLVAAYMQAAGFQNLTQHSHVPETSDPLWTVIGRAPDI
jgi:SAM-dependent methyltransferase